MASPRINARSIVVVLPMLSLPCSAAAQDVAGRFALATDLRREHLVLLSTDGSVVETKDGSRSSVVIDRRLDALLLEPGAHLTIVHNHPHSGGLTCSDLLQLAKPGVDRVVALGANGSRYDASRGPRYDTRRFEEHQCKPAHDKVTSEIPGLPRDYIDGRSLEDLIEHMTSVALQTAGVLDYTASLQGRRAIISAKSAGLIRYVVKTAVQRLAREEDTSNHESHRATPQKGAVER